MSGFKRNDDFNERLSAAAKAKQDTLEKFGSGDAKLSQKARSNGWARVLASPMDYASHIVTK
jgi:hypothetical protein